MANARVATRYAKSLLNLAEEEKLLEKVHQDMQLVKATCESSREFRGLLKSPIIESHHKLRISKVLFEAKVQKLSMEFLKLVFRKNREFFLYEMTLMFVKLYNQAKGLQPASIKTAFPITDALRKEFVTIVKEVSGKEPILTEEVDQNMIGGFILKIEDRQIDASVSTRLKRLRADLGV